MGAIIVKVGVLLPTPFTVTWTVEEFLIGVSNVIAVALQFETVVITSLPNLTVLVPWLVPNPLPLIVTELWTCPEVGERVEMTGVTVRVMPLLAAPLTTTLIEPVVAHVGTVN
jgi:hypothetical protein